MSRRREGRFTEIQFGDLLQKAIGRMERSQAHQQGDKTPNLINVLEAARVAVELLQDESFPWVEVPDPVCPKGDEMHDEFPFLCACGITYEMIEDAFARIKDDEDASKGMRCFHCGEPIVPRGQYPPHPRHEELWVRGPRVWGTVWHGSRDY